MRKFLKDKRSGFTLIEILVVIGIIAVLAGVVLIAINPARQFRQARDTQRTSNVEAILNAIGQYIADNKGAVPAGISTSTAQNISSAASNLCSSLVPTYLSALPSDPSSPSAGADITNCGTYDTGYKIIMSSTTSRITVSAPNTETATTAISITR